MKKTINLGDIPMYKWNLGDPLYPYWYEKEEIDYIDPKEVILEPNTDYKLCITYPLSRDFIQKISTKDEGMTRESLISVIVTCYRQIYKEEESTSDVDASHIMGMYNRIMTNGTYGIWGHDLSDLVLCSLNINGKILTIGVDS